MGNPAPASSGKSTASIVLEDGDKASPSYHPGRFLMLGDERQRPEVVCAFSTDTCLFPACLFSFFQLSVEVSGYYCKFIPVACLPSENKRNHSFIFHLFRIFFFA